MTTHPLSVCKSDCRSSQGEQASLAAVCLRGVGIVLYKGLQYVSYGLPSLLHQAESMSRCCSSVRCISQNVGMVHVYMVVSHQRMISKVGEMLAVLVLNKDEKGPTSLARVLMSCSTSKAAAFRLS